MNKRINKLALITGGTKGLGRELALALARENYQVFATFHSDEEAAEDLRSLFEKEKLEGDCLRWDVRKELIKPERLAALSPEDDLTVIHCATGPFVPQPFHLIDWSAFQEQYDIAVRGAWNATHAFLPAMVSAKKGTLINVLTEILNGPMPKGFAAYASAKYALMGLTQALAAEYSSRGLKIYSVSPGFMETPLTANWPAAFKATGQKDGKPFSSQAAALQVIELLKDPGTAGKGEDHPLGLKR